MYTISQAAIRSGLTIPTIRAWERRYGVVRPARTASGYRLYDDDALDRLLAMRQLVEVEGLRPSQAADQVLTAGSGLAQLVARAKRRPDGVADPASVPETTDLVDAIRAATRVMDVTAVEQVLDEAFAAERFEAAVSHVVFPALRAIGDDWADGTIDVAMEHAASETIRRRLARFFDAAAVAGRGFEVIVGLPPGGQHEIGALGFAVAARRRGLTVLYLGANVPVASWVLAAEATRARVAVVGVVGEPDAIAAMETIEALITSTSRPTVAVGGRAAPRVADQEGVIVLPDALAPAVDVVRGLARGSRR